MKMLEPYILIEPTESEVKRPSGIIIPETAKEKPQEGKVIASYKDCDIHVGDVVIYKKWGGYDVKEGDKELLIVEDKDVLAIREDNE